MPVDTTSDGHPRGRARHRVRPPVKWKWNKPVPEVSREWRIKGWALKEELEKEKEEAKEGGQATLVDSGEERSEATKTKAGVGILDGPN